MERLTPHIIEEWRRRTKLKGPLDHLQTREFREAVETLSIIRNSFEQDPTLLGGSFLSESKNLTSFLLYFWPLYYQEALSLLGELPKEPKRCLDLSEDAGATAFALLRQGAEEVISTSISSEALEIGASLAGRDGYTLASRRWNPLEESCPIEGSFDVITCCHTLDLLFSEKDKEEERFIEMLLSKLSEDGILLLTLGSLPRENRRLLRLRDRLVKSGYAVQAPCIWQGECPALEAKFPCFAQRPYEKTPLLKELQRALEIQLSSLKVTYLMVLKSGKAAPEIADPPVWRVVSPPFDSPLGRHCYLCGTDGKRRLVDKSNEHQGFGYLRRGDLIHVEEAKESKKNISLTDSSEIKIVAACGKPLPEIG